MPRSPAKNKGTKPNLLGVSRDITDRVRAEEQLREREDQYRSIFETTTDGLGVVDMEGYIVEVNPAYCRLTGYSRDELIGLHATDLMHPDDVHLIAEGMRTIAESGQSAQSISRLVRKDGTLLHVEGHGTAFLFKGESHILGVVRDITDRVRAYELLEERVEERTRELSTLLNVSKNVSSTLELRPLLDLVLDQLKDVVRYAGASISLIDRDESEIVAYRGRGSADIVVGLRVPLEHMARLDHMAHIWESWRSGSSMAGPIIIDDVRADTPDAVAYRSTESVLLDSSFSYVRSWMAVPLIVGDRLVGILTLNGDEPNLYTPHHAELAMALAQQAAIAIENARLYEQATERTRELSTLLDVSSNVTSTLELHPLLDTILDQLKSVVEYVGAGIVVQEDNEVRIVRQRGPESALIPPETRIPMAEARPLWELIAQRQRIIIGDVRGETTEAQIYRELVGDSMRAFPYIRSWMAVPMSVKDRQIGALFLAHSESGVYGAHHADLAQAIAQQAAVAIENARLYEQATERTRELTTLLDVSRTVTSTLQLEPLLNLILDQLNLVAENDGIALLEARGEEFVVLLRRMPGHQNQDFPARYSTQSRGPFWDKIRGGEIVIIGDVRGDDPMAVAYRQTVGDYLDTSLSFERSFMAVPLMLKDRIIGHLGLTSARLDYYTPHHGELALAIAQQAAIAIENARLYERAQEVAVLEERQRLSRELHDSVSQVLYSVALGIKTGRVWLDRDPQRAAEPLDFALAQAEIGLAEMRALIFELRPEALEKEGLVAALERQTALLQARNRISVQADFGDEPNVPLPIKETLYRVAQEALHNIAKHAEASDVQVCLSHAADYIALEIRDNGKGFDSTGSFPGHLGLQSMRERAAGLGGSLDVESAAGAGTRVRAHVPCPPGKE